MLTFEDTINKVEENMNKVWKSQTEQYKVDKSSSERYLLLLHLNSLPRILRV